MKKRNFSAEFKRESAQLVVDQNYTVADAASAMDVGLSTMTRWVKQLRDERQGKTPKASPITPEQIEIRPPPLPRNKLKSVSSGKSY
ncbi:transposase, partial [Escherichia coli]|uniref:transposase n=1 Tax=Escherichia coli TaxID=562 RepID=UPI00237EEA90